MAFGGTTSLLVVGLLTTVRYVLPALLIVAGFVVLFVVDGDLRWDGWAMLSAPASRSCC